VERSWPFFTGWDLNLFIMVIGIHAETLSTGTWNHKSKTQAFYQFSYSCWLKWEKSALKWALWARGDAVVMGYADHPVSSCPMILWGFAHLCPLRVQPLKREGGLSPSNIIDQNTVKLGFQTEKGPSNYCYQSSINQSINHSFIHSFIQSIIVYFNHYYSWRH